MEQIDRRKGMIEQTLKDGHEKQQPAIISPDELAQAKAMLIIHFAAEKRLTQAMMRGRMPGENQEQQGDMWELLELVLTALRWTEAQRAALSKRCELIHETDVRSRVPGSFVDVARVPGLSASAMLIHLDVCAKEQRIKRSMKPIHFRILEMMLSPVSPRQGKGQIRLRSLREVSSIISKPFSKTRRMYNFALVRAAEVLIKNHARFEGEK